MNDSTITLKKVDELRLDATGAPQRYHIASYQRGYRWSTLQVRQLLEDILEFTRRRNPQPEDFYCLQPIVLKANPDNVFEVVDGQQRLTTLLLLLRYFNERLAEKFRQKLFALEYETRPDLLDFLDDPTDDKAKSNIDFFHLNQAIETIEKWFGDKESEVERIKSALLNDTKVIWFQLGEQDNAVEAFTRLNVGKIPLTNDELIRALFLRRTDESQSGVAAPQLKIAYEWDQLEKALQSDDFWYFLSNRTIEGCNRIGLLFDLVTQTEGVAAQYGNDANAIFYAYSKKLNDDNAKPDAEWLKIKQMFMALEEWFEDRRLYHVVGFLINQRVEIPAIRQLAEQKPKKVFARNLKQAVWAQVFGADQLAHLSSDKRRAKIEETLEDLEYGKNKSAIRSILLLFNLATLLEDPRSNMRFQFSSFKQESWDIEHVRSVASDRPERLDDRKKWLEHCRSYLESRGEKAALQKEIVDFIKRPQNQASHSIFEPLYEKVLQVFDEFGDEADHSIANLTLLDSKTNRSYKNAVFAVKRQKLLELDQSGIFVPLCTRNVFLKCYSPQVDNVMFWNAEDRKQYRKKIVDTLYDFFADEQQEAGE